MDLNLREMIGGNPARLRWVYRYSTSRVRHPESVAEHSFYVAFYALMVGHWVISNDQERYFSDGKPINVNMEVLLERAILHDLEEAKSGDFPRSFKHSNEKMKKLLDEAAEEAFDQVMWPVLGGRPEGADELYAVPHFHWQWHNAKDDSIEGRILEFCDFLAVLGFLLQEGMGEGNGTIGVHVEGMSIYYGKFQRDAYNFLKPLVSEAGGILNQLGILDTALVAKGRGS